MLERRCIFHSQRMCTSFSDAFENWTVLSDVFSNAMLRDQVCLVDTSQGYGLIGEKLLQNRCTPSCRAKRVRARHRTEAC